MMRGLILVFVAIVSLLTVIPANCQENYNLTLSGKAYTFLPILPATEGYGYTIELNLTNVGSDTFPGGSAKIRMCLEDHRYIDLFEVNISPIEPGGSFPIKKFSFKDLDSGARWILVDIESQDGQQIELIYAYDVWSRAEFNGFMIGLAGLFLAAIGKKARS